MTKRTLPVERVLPVEPERSRLIGDGPLIVRSAREDVGLSTIEVAAAIGVNQSTYWRFEQGQTTMPKANILRLVEFLDLPSPSSDWTERSEELARSSKGRLPRSSARPLAKAVVGRRREEEEASRRKAS